MQCNVLKLLLGLVLRSRVTVEVRCTFVMAYFPGVSKSVHLLWVFVYIGFFLKLFSNIWYFPRKWHLEHILYSSIPEKYTPTYFIVTVEARVGEIRRRFKGLRRFVPLKLRWCSKIYNYYSLSILLDASIYIPSSFIHSLSFMFLVSSCT